MPREKLGRMPRSAAIAAGVASLLSLRLTAGRTRKLKYRTGKVSFRSVRMIDVTLENHGLPIKNPQQLWLTLSSQRRHADQFGV